MDKTDNIIQMIGSYTEQIERYENLSTWFAAFSVLCILMVCNRTDYPSTKRRKRKQGTLSHFSVGTFFNRTFHYQPVSVYVCNEHAEGGSVPGISEFPGVTVQQFGRQQYYVI